MKKARIAAILLASSIPVIISFALSQYLLTEVAAASPSGRLAAASTPNKGKPSPNKKSPWPSPSPGFGWIGTQSSENWSGYVAATNLLNPQAGSVSDVRGTWTVPAVTGPNDGYSATWVGIDGYADNTVEQVGVAADWEAGTAYYGAWYEMYPSSPVLISSVPVSPGDSITARVSYLGGNQFLLSITDNTTSQSFSTVQTSFAAQRESAEWIVEAPSSSQTGQVLPLANFGVEDMTGASVTINGHTGAINDAAWQNDDLYIVSATGNVEDSVSPLESAGTAFKVFYGNVNFTPLNISNTGGDCAQIGSWNSGNLTCTLNRDVTMYGSGGIVITSDGVTVDGAGHTITGDGTTLASGVEADNRTGVTIRNLNVQHFQDGIYFGNTTGSTISGNNSSNNFRSGISVNSSATNSISGNTCGTNTDTGIYDFNSTSDALAGNTAQSNTANGILVQNGTSAAVTSNIIAGSPNGLFLSSATGTLVRGNKISNNTSYGIYLNGSSNSTVSNNVFVSNSTQAYVTGGSGNIFYGGLSPGNYWSDFNSPAQGCHDTNADGICDASYTFTGGNDPAPVTLPYEVSSYDWTWYDNVNADNWVLLANQRFSAADAWFDLAIAGSPMALPRLAGLQPGQLPPNSIITPMYGGIVNGPVNADARAGGSVVTSQRTLWPKGGSSLEEIPGTPGSALSDIFYWPWYDEQTPGMSDWVLVSNPNNYQVYYEISIDGMSPSSGTIAPGGKVTPEFHGVIGGPVKVQAWTDSGKGEPARVMASQRVLSGGGGAFNEVPGIDGRTGALSSDYYWSWYDQHSPGAQDWVLIANPPGAAQPIYYSITIGGTPAVTNGGPIAPGASQTPQFPGWIGGPVEVKTYTNTNDPPGSAAPSICTQRSLWGPSFEEVPGLAHNALNWRHAWTWYDQSTPGMSDWVLVGNPSGSSIYYEIHLAGNPTPVSSGSIPAGQSVQPAFPAQIGGPVDVQTWTDSSKAVIANSFASQRVLYNNYFNEVWGQ